MTNQKTGDKGFGREITIDRHYVGPPNMAQGGYISGTMAVHLASDTVEVTMRNPTPMGKPLLLDTSAPDRVVIYDGDKVLNEARPADLNLDMPEPISLAQARTASLRHVKEMPYPDCFGCGSARSDDDGLHLRSGPVAGRKIVATDWVPRAAAVGADMGEPVPEPIVWAAMECPIARAMDLEEMKAPEELIVLGRMTTRVHALPTVGEACFFMGWPIERAGRKIHLAGTLHNATGQVLVATLLTFVTLRPGVTYDTVLQG
jgi:hypothetical protein